MDGQNRALVVLLSMHRSGSSLTANVLQELGMSLGPFELLGAEPTNPHGHFESIPFHDLNRKAQEWAFGFSDDLPDDPEIRARFVESEAEWPTDRPIPEEWLEEGEQLTRTLLLSGSPSGFKDPRTVLTWPFWRRVFERIENLQVIPAILLRSPHEIAMSLCSRARGEQPYWDALDVVGVNLKRLRIIADEFGGRVSITRFATPHFRADLKRLVEGCGLPWSDEIVDRVYDHSCVHQLPAAVSHPSQELFDALCGEDWLNIDVQDNARRIARDARRVEALAHERLAELRDRLDRTEAAFRHAEALFAEADQGARDWRAEAARFEQALGEAREDLAQTREELIRTRDAYELTSECLAQSERNLVETIDCLVSIQERHASNDEPPIRETWRRDAGSQSSLSTMLDQFVGTQDRLDRERDDANRRLDEAHERIAAMKGMALEREERLKEALERGDRLNLEAHHLRSRLDRFESHVLVGAALRGRRKVKQMWLKLRHRGDGGVERSARVDQAH